VESTEYSGETTSEEAETEYEISYETGSISETELEEDGVQGESSFLEENNEETE